MAAVVAAEAGGGSEAKASSGGAGMSAGNPQPRTQAVTRQPSVPRAPAGPCASPNQGSAKGRATGRGRTHVAAEVDEEKVTEKDTAREMTEHHNKVNAAVWPVRNPRQRVDVQMAKHGGKFFGNPWGGIRKTVVIPFWGRTGK